MPATAMASGVAGGAIGAGDALEGAAATGDAALGGAAGAIAGGTASGVQDEATRARAMALARIRKRSMGTRIRKGGPRMPGKRTQKENLFFRPAAAGYGRQLG